MEFIQNLLDLEIKQKTAVTLGKFDGLHRGHKKLLNQVLRKREEGYRSAIFTFDMPPNKVLTGKNKRVILTNEERKRMLYNYGVDILVECPFTRDIASMEPERFVKEILLDKMNAGYIAVGTDFHFGYERKGDIYLLDKLSRKYRFRLLVLSKEQYQGRDISSTYVRELLNAGDLSLAGELLGYSYFVSGKIVKGKQLGRTMGIPTINLLPHDSKLLPPNGVYASRVLIDGIWYRGMTNIGLRPTVENSQVRNVETHIFDFQEEVYDKEAKVELLAFQRPEQKFSSLEMLKAQLYKDMLETKRIMGKYAIDNKM